MPAVRASGSTLHQLNLVVVIASWALCSGKTQGNDQSRSICPSASMVLTLPSAVEKLAPYDGQVIYTSVDQTDLLLIWDCTSDIPERTLETPERRCGFSRPSLNTVRRRA